jgi:hypothetical protein
MRTSVDVIDQSTGAVTDGFDYQLQVWVSNGIIQDCGHSATSKASHCCNAHRLAGRNILETNGREVRS